MIETLTGRAQGVFLWVSLVGSFIRGLTGCDSFEDLEKRKNELLEDLKTYFRHMLQTIVPIYWDDTVRAIKLTTYARQRLPIAAYDLLQQERADPNFALAPNVSLKGDAMSRTRKRLNARCKDLLEVTHLGSEIGLFKYQADFLHCTVRDFFLGTDALKFDLKERPAVEFDPLVNSSRIMLGFIKPAGCNV